LITGSEDYYIEKFAHVFYYLFGVWSDMDVSADDFALDGFKWDF
jgi:hypothetical protein